jgi:asparagine synthase (glutamine-hydrolysing)
MTSWTPWEIAQLLGAADRAPRVGAPDRQSFADQMARTDMRHFLPDDILVKVDRTTMATGSRGASRFLDHRLASSRCACRSRCAAARSAPSTCCAACSTRYVPRELLERPKQGFGIPLAAGCAASWRRWCTTTCAPQRIRDAGLFDPDMVRARSPTSARAARNDRLDMQKLWYLIAFELWRERWMEAAR